MHFRSPPIPIQPAESPIGYTTIRDLEKKVEEGDAKSAAKLCSIYRQTNEPKKLHKWAQKGTELGDPESMYWLSLFEFEANFDKAKFWLETAGCRGHVPSMVMMGHLYRQGFCQSDHKVKSIIVRTERNWNLALRWYTIASKSGNPIADTCVGELYFEVKNYKKAIKWYEMAGDFGPALKRIGDLYREGLGVIKNPEAARDYYERAAHYGSKLAAQELKEMDLSYLSRLFRNLFG